MQPRLDDALLEYSFTAEELKMAQLLDPLKIAYYQTLYAKIWKTRNSIQLPGTPNLDREYMQQIIEIDGKLAMLQELMDGHKQVLIDIDKGKEGAAGSTEQIAANLVDKQPKL